MEILTELTRSQLNYRYFSIKNGQVQFPAALLPASEESNDNDKIMALVGLMSVNVS